MSMIKAGKVLLISLMLESNNPSLVGQGILAIANLLNPPKALIDRVQWLSINYPDPTIRGRCVALLGSLQPDLYTGDILDDTSQS